MNISQNFHPDIEWVAARTYLYGPGDGSCVVLCMEDNAGYTFNLAMHYGDEKNANKFIAMLKEVISKLPVKCNTCGQEIREG